MGFVLTAAERHTQRVEQLLQTSDGAFAAQVRAHQAAVWRTADLDSHAKAHRRDFLVHLNNTLVAAQLRALSHDILRTWDRLFTELEPDGSVTYHFVRSLPESGAAILVVTRGGRIRTAYPTEDLTRRLERRPALTEVTNRAKRLGLSD